MEAIKKKINSKESGPSDEANVDKPTQKPSILQFKMMLVISSNCNNCFNDCTCDLYFLKRITKKIQENNLELVRIVNSKSQNLVAEINKAKMQYPTLKQEFKTKSQKKFFIDQYFKNDNSFIYLGVYKKLKEKWKW